MDPTAAMLDEPPAEDEVADPRRRTLILVAACTALVAVVASVSGLNVAQAALATELGATQSDLLWIINGYTIALAALLLPLGAIGDRWGRKRVLVSGLVLFVAANAAAAFAGGVTALLVARVVAGVAAAMIMPATLSVITSSFPVAERDRAVGVWAGLAGAGGIIGLVGSALIVDHATWPWVFALPVGLALAALAVTVPFVPHSHEHVAHRFDTVGSVLSAVALGALVLGIHEGPEVGWTAPLTLAGLVVGGLALVGFVVWELRHPHPLLDLRVFRNRMLTAGSVSLLVVFAIMMALFLVLVQFLQAVLGYSAVHAAVALLPLAAVLMPMSSAAPHIARRVGMRAMFVGGSLLVAAGLAMLAAMASTAGYLTILPGLLVLGAGVGILMTPGTTAITGSLPAEEQGVASALNDTVREFGGAIGMALIGSVLSAAYSASVAGATAGLPEQAASAVEGGIGGAVAVSSQMGPAGAAVMDAARSAFLDGWATAMWLSAGLALAAALFALVWTPSRRLEHAERDAVLGAASGLDPVPLVVEGAGA
jgi:EmrB/QacA subfamily drug resistance transporter